MRALDTKRWGRSVHIYRFGFGWRMSEEVRGVRAGGFSKLAPPG